MPAQNSFKHASHIIPPLLAALVVWCEPIVARWDRTSEALLPLFLLLVLATLVHPHLRHYMTITLCYSVAWLALRDISNVKQTTLPPLLDSHLIFELRLIALWIVSVLAIMAGCAESIRPGTVWVRRCYFLSASVYFCGLGVMEYGWHGSWRAVMLCVTGVMAFMGCLFAEQVVAAEKSQDDTMIISDEALQKAREQSHRTKLQAKEWRGNLVTAMEEKDTCRD